MKYSIALVAATLASMGSAAAVPSDLSDLTEKALCAKSFTANYDDIKSVLPILDPVIVPTPYMRLNYDGWKVGRQTLINPIGVKAHTSPNSIFYSSAKGAGAHSMSRGLGVRSFDMHSLWYGCTLSPTIDTTVPVHCRIQVIGHKLDGSTVTTIMVFNPKEPKGVAFANQFEHTFTTLFAGLTAINFKLIGTSVTSAVTQISIDSFAYTIHSLCT